MIKVQLYAPTVPLVKNFPSIIGLISGWVQVAIFLAVMIWINRIMVYTQFYIEKQVKIELRLRIKCLKHVLKNTNDLLRRQYLRCMVPNLPNFN